MWRALANILTTTTRPVGDYLTLRRFERQRRGNNALMAKTLSALNWITRQNNQPWQCLRATGMRMINNSDTLKTYLQRFASGL